MMAPGSDARLRPMTEGDRAVPFELFFDLVFVYAITQVTGLMAHDMTPQGIIRGMLVLGVLWWCWSGFTWLGNTVRLDEGIARTGLLTVMAAMFVVSLAIPEVFHDEPGGLPAPLVFVACYFVVRLVHQLLFMRAGRGNPALRKQLLLNWVPWLGGVALLSAAAFVHTESGWLETLLWAAALGWDYSFVLLNGMSGWRVSSAAHFAERYGLIIIIAIGESIVAVGVGAADLILSWPIVVGAVLAVGIASALWWVYFDVTSLAAERRLTEATGIERTYLASHGYTYLHIMLIAGIILLALGIEEALAYAGGRDGHSVSDAMHGIGLYALYGGVALYLAGHILFGRRMFGTWKGTRITACAAVVMAVPLANVLPALAALGLLAAILAVMIGVETVRYAQARAAIRNGVPG